MVFQHPLVELAIASTILAKSISIALNEVLTLEDQEITFMDITT